MPRSEPRPPAEHPPAWPDPEPVPTAAPLGGNVAVQAGARQITLSNLDKPLFPSEFAKGQVIHYYSSIAPVLLPHLAGRPVTIVRFPDGIGGPQFFEKNVPPGAPVWLSTVRLPSSSSRSRHGERGESIEYPLLDELAALAWEANNAALEIHVPQYTVELGPLPVRRPPDRLVFDLDPGPGTSIVDCCRVAERLQDVLAADGLSVFPKTSGSKGMLYRISHRGDRSQLSLAISSLRLTIGLPSSSRILSQIVGLTDWLRTHDQRHERTPRPTGALADGHNVVGAAGMHCAGPSSASRRA